jgi:hypothetical protein
VNVGGFPGGAEGHAVLARLAVAVAQGARPLGTWAALLRSLPSFSLSVRRCRGFEKRAEAAPIRCAASTTATACSVAKNPTVTNVVFLLWLQGGKIQNSIFPPTGILVFFGFAGCAVLL